MHYEPRILEIFKILDASLKSEKTNIAYNQMKYLCISHRGNTKACLGKENTWFAFQQALSQQNVDMIEMDVRITKDFKFVVCHNNMFEQEFVSNSTFDDITKDNGLPEWEDIMTKIFKHPNKKCKFIVEIKPPFTHSAKLREQLPRVLTQMLYMHQNDWDLSRLIIMSFDEPILNDVIDYTKKFHELAKLRFGLIMATIPMHFHKRNSLLAKYHYMSIGHKELCRFSDIENLKAAYPNIKMFIYTLNHPKIIDYIEKSKIFDGIISDVL